MQRLVPIRQFFFFPAVQFKIKYSFYLSAILLFSISNHTITASFYMILISGKAEVWVSSKLHVVIHIG